MPRRVGGVRDTTLRICSVESLSIETCVFSQFAIEEIILHFHHVESLKSFTLPNTGQARTCRWPRRRSELLCGYYYYFVNAVSQCIFMSPPPSSEREEKQNPEFSRGVNVGRWTDGKKWSPLTKREQCCKEKLGNNNGSWFASHKCFVSNCKWNDVRIGGGNADTAYGYAWICAIGR